MNCAALWPHTCFVSFFSYFLISVVKAIVSNWSTYNMCTVYCVTLHWVGGELLRHILIFVIDVKERGETLDFLIYLPQCSFIDSVVLVNLVLTGGRGWRAIAVREFALSVYE